MVSHRAGQRDPEGLVAAAPAARERDGSTPPSDATPMTLLPASQRWTPDAVA
jgi:hypothetical protein